MATHKTGGEIDVFCARCKLLLAHTILAMVGAKVARVKCNTCGSDRTHRGEAARSPARQKSDKPRVARIEISFAQELAKHDLSKKRKYDFRQRYLLDEIVDHPTFGLGLVSGVRDDKIDVTFKSDVKTLVHGRATQAQRILTQPRPSEPLADEP